MLLDYRNLTGILSRSDGLLERAEAALRRVVAADPNDATALLRLGDVQRSDGRLDEAIECYRKAASLRPDDPRARWLVAILSGRELPDAPAVGAVPFVRVADFLPSHRCRQLLAVALANREQFARPKPTIDTPKGKVNAALRKGLSLSLRVTDREVRPWFEARLRTAFAAALPRLGRREPRRYRVEMGMSAFLGGGFLAKHSDNRPRFHNRRLSFVYYFHRQPRPFSGGALLLHDADGRAFTRIEPQHNSIVFFPPECVHEIAAVEGGGASGGGQEGCPSHVDFGDARFTIQGWLRALDEEA